MMTKFKKIISSLLTAVMLLGISPCFTASASNDIVLNGNMNEGTPGKAPNKWGASVNTSKDGEGSFAYEATAGVDGTGCVVADIKNDGTAVNTFQLTQNHENVPVSAQKKYTIKFDAKVEGVDSYTINRVWLRNIEANELASEESSVKVSGNTWKTYTVELDGKKDVGGMKIMFQFGNNNVKGAKLYIDNVVSSGFEVGSASSSSASTPSATKAPTATNAPVATMAPDAEVKGISILKNGDISKENDKKMPANWGISINQGRNAKGVATYETTGGADNSRYLLLNLETDGTATNAIEITQELPDIEFKEGKKYVFSIDAKVEGVSSYIIQRIWVRNSEKNESLTKVASLEIKGSDWKTYKFELPGKISHSGIKMMLQLGNTGAKNVKIGLDNIKLIDPDATLADTPAPAPTAKPNSYPVPAPTKCIFEDCTNHWARNEIEVMQKKEVINGKSLTLFAPEDNITRAEFLALVTRATGVGETAFDGCYPDVSGKWYADTVQAGFDAGIINQGMIADGIFEGDKAITREEMTSMISAGYKILTGEDAKASDISHFTDNGSVSPWATEDVKKAYGIGIIKGITETTFEPKWNATRAQAAVMIYRLKNYGEKSFKASFDNDITGFNVTGKGEYTFKHDATEGASGKGSLLIDIGYSGDASAAVQVDCTAARNDGKPVIEMGKKYIVSFAAKLEGADAFPIGVIRCRAVGGGSDHTTRSGYTLTAGGWKTHHIVLNGIDNQSQTALVFSAGGCKQSDFKVWLDDISIEEYNISTKVEVAVADGLESISHITGTGKYPEGEQASVYAGTKAGQNYLFYSWVDKYGNNIDQSSYSDVDAQGTVIMNATYKPYTVTDKGYTVSATAARPEIDMSAPVASGDSATVTANVKLPEGYKLADAGAVFYNESYVDALNVFTENAKVVSADTVGADGAFTATATGFKDTDDILVKAYAIYKDEAGNVFVHYSDDKILQRKTGEIKPYKIVSNYEMMAGYGPEQITNYIGTDLEMLTITPGLYRTNMWRSEVDTQWKDYVHGESGEVGGDLEKRVEAIMQHLKDGRDLFGEMVTLGQQQDFDIYVNYRMNDSHRTDNPTSQTHNRFYREHLDDLVVNGTARVLNYMDPEVREYYYRIVEELVTNYDVDGLELDFERSPNFFHAEEITVGTGVMTDFVGRIRAMLDRVGAQKGKYLPLSVRVRKSLASSLSVGLDVAEWERRGYIDMINVTQHYINTTELDVESYMNIAKTSRVHAELQYLSYQPSVNGKQVRQFCQPELLRATAANFLARGVDGITFFNLNYAGDFLQILDGINNIKDPEILKNQEKLYNVTNGQGTFPAAGKKSYKLVIADDTSGGIFKTAKMRVVYEGDVSGETVEVSINGVKLQETTHDSDTTELFPEIRNGKGNGYYPSKEKCKYFNVPLSAIKKGSNEFTIECTTNARVRITATDLALYK